MNDPERSAVESLTGVWNGVFRQPYRGSITFTATLIETGHQITGSTHEPCAQTGCPRKTHLAILSGHRRGRAVSFVKTYDPPGFGYDTVTYSGELNGDATEIAGMWTIEPRLSGAFLMIRAGRRAQVRTREKLAEV